MPLPSSRATSSSGIASICQGNNLLNTSSLLLFLNSHNLLTAIPPFLLTKLESLGFDLLDRHCLRLNVLPPQTRHENLLPLVGSADKELSSTLEWLL